MSTTTVGTALDRIARLIPVRSATLVGDYAAVCTPSSTVPAELQQAQEERHNFYMTHTWEEGNRCKPDHGPRYFVTYRGMLIAWVTLDGRTHFVDELSTTHSAGQGGNPRATFRTAWRHQQTIRDEWPEQFVMDSQGDPVF